MSDQDPVSALADAIMGPDRVKAVGYWLRVDGVLVFIKTRSCRAELAVTLPASHPPFPFIDGLAKSLVALARPGVKVDTSATVPRSQGPTS
jgi:hypothetical protein